MEVPSVSAPPATLIPADAEITALRARIAALEAERDEYAQQNAELFVLQQVFSAMNSTLEIDDILAMVLRGVHEALRVGRVVLFDVRDGVVTPRMEAGPDGIVDAPHSAGVRATGTLAALAAGRLDLALGEADDGESPIPDPDGAWCIVPLTSRQAVRGLLYIDRSPDPIGEAQVRPLLDFATQAAVALENARLLAETRRLLEETQRLAATDPLTGLANRRALGELLERELHNAERYGSPLAFVVLDLDDLKRINDHGGHAAGDEALRRFAEALRAGARRGDVVARYGGDEFVLVLTQTDRAAAETALRRLYATLEPSGLRCSAGIALCPPDGADGDTLFAAADGALYAAKQAGKYRFAFATPPA